MLEAGPVRPLVAELQIIVTATPEAHGVRFIATSQNIDTDESNPAARFLLHILMAAAEFERELSPSEMDHAGICHYPDCLFPLRILVFTAGNILTVPLRKVDPYRRNLQRAYLDLANTKINGQAPAVPAGLPAEFAAQFVSSGDEKPFYRAELRSLNTAINTALAKTTDRATRAHLEGAHDQIAKILDPKFAQPAAAAAGAIRVGLADPFSGVPGEAPECWPDYIIRP